MVWGYSPTIKRLPPILTCPTQTTGNDGCKRFNGREFRYRRQAGGIVLTSVFGQVRDAAFFPMIALTAGTYKLDVNFHSHYWYRSTTRGLEVLLVDILAGSVLISSFLFPRHDGPRWFWLAGLGFMLIFFLYAGTNVAFSYLKIFGVFELPKMLLCDLRAFHQAVDAALLRLKLAIQYAATGCQLVGTIYDETALSRTMKELYAELIEDKYALRHSSRR
jgi:hypothetical protein